jgi:23S rRNA (uracil1939-C5)-methyltransferase
MSEEPDRFDCVHRVACGACSLMHLRYGDQLAVKRARVATSASRHPALGALAVREAVGAEPRSGYRARAKVMVAEGARVGLFGVKGDHEVVDTPGCIVLSPLLSRVFALHRRLIADDEERVGGALAPSAGRPPTSGLLAIDAREVTSGGAPAALVTWVIARGPGFKLESYRTAAAALREAMPDVLGVALNFHEGDTPQVLGKETLLLSGQSWANDAVGSAVHRATFGSFVQAHRGQAARIHAVIASAVLEGRDRPVRVLDLYGGSGAIALSLAAAGADVTMVESFGPAVEHARESARAAGLPLTAERGDVAVALAELGRRGRAFDAAVVNPPRRGLDPLVRARLAALGLETVVYVSCQPETLARDLDHLARLGLAAEELLPFDMIPLTEEVETVAVLRRSPLPAPTVLYEDGEVVVVDKPPHEPTTPQGEYVGSLLGRVQGLRGAERAVPVHRLDVGTSGAVIFAKDAARASRWSAAMQAEGAEKTYVAAVRGLPGERGEIDRALTIEGKSKPAHTRFVRTALLGNHALVEVVPEEGRTHQIRRHLASIGHPVLGDARYGHAATNRFLHEKYGLDRTFLHAMRLSLVHPSTGRRLTVAAPLPGDLAAVVSRVAESRRAG